MLRGAPVIAQLPAAGHHATVGQQQRPRVVVARRRLVGHLREGAGGRVPQLGREHRGRVAERHRDGLAAERQHLAVREDDAVRERTGVGHAAQLGHDGA